MPNLYTVDDVLAMGSALTPTPESISLAPAKDFTLEGEELFQLAREVRGSEAEPEKGIVLWMGRTDGYDVVMDPIDIDSANVLLPLIRLEDTLFDFDPYFIEKLKNRVFWGMIQQVNSANANIRANAGYQSRWIECAQALLVEVGEPDTTI